MVVGGGPVAASKVAPLLRAGAHVRVVAPLLHDDIIEAHASGAHAGFELQSRAFEARDLADAWLVVSAAPPDVNREVVAVAEALRVFVVAVDDSAVATAYGAGLIERGGITLAISSGGAAPGLVHLARRALEAILPDDVERWTETARLSREEWKKSGVPMGARVPLLLAALNDLYAKEAS